MAKFTELKTDYKIPAVACKNFVEPGWSLVEFRYIESALLENKPTKVQKLADDALEAVLSSEQEMQMRIDKFPAVALMDDQGEKINYRDYICFGENTDCTHALCLSSTWMSYIL